jgi:hypothetical protein
VRQDCLFDNLSTQMAGLVKRVKAEMQESVRRSGLSRHQVLDRMNAVAQTAGIRLTTGNSKSLGLATLEKWLNPSNTDQIPGILAINVLCAVLHDIASIEVQLAIHGCEAMTEQDRLERDYGRACLAMREARRRKRDLEANL